MEPRAAAAAAAAAEAAGDVAGQRGAGPVGEPVQVVVEDGPGQRDEDALEDEGAADGEQDGGHLVLDQRAEAEPEEAEQDGRGQQPGHDGADLVGHLGRDAAEGGVPGQRHGGHGHKRQERDEDGPQAAVATTLATRTRVRTGVSTSDVVMVLCRYSPVMQSTPMMGARISIPK